MDPPSPHAGRPRTGHSAVERHLGPFFHAIASLPSNVVEYCRAPAQILRQESDWKALIQRFPAIAPYADRHREFEALLEPAYADYVATVSSPLITLSLNRAAFLLFLGKALQVRKVLDLGSGFSSYVFRMYAREEGGVDVISVDDSTHWLHETATFLDRYDLPATNLISLTQWIEREGLPRVARFDLCLLDIGDTPLRVRLLPELILAMQDHGGTVIADDFHVAAYRASVEDLCRKARIHVYSLRKVTRRRLSHAALLCP
jgi:predicted O-methyltransferase YrrM